MDERSFKDKFRQRAPASPSPDEAGAAHTDPPPPRLTPGDREFQMSMKHWDARNVTLHVRGGRITEALKGDKDKTIAELIRRGALKPVEPPPSSLAPVHLLWKCEADGTDYAIPVVQCTDAFSPEDFEPRMYLETAFELPKDVGLVNELTRKMGETAYLKVASQLYEIRLLKIEQQLISTNAIRVRIAVRPVGRIS